MNIKKFNRIYDVFFVVGLLWYVKLVEESGLAVVEVFRELWMVDEDS